MADKGKIEVTVIYKSGATMVFRTDEVPDVPPLPPLPIEMPPPSGLPRVGACGVIRERTRFRKRLARLIGGAA